MVALDPAGLEVPRAGGVMTEAFRCRVCNSIMWPEEARFFDGLGWAHPACQDEYTQEQP